METPRLLPRALLLVLLCKEVSVCVGGGGGVLPLIASSGLLLSPRQGLKSPLGRGGQQGLPRSSHVQTPGTVLERSTRKAHQTSIKELEKRKPRL